VVWSGKVVAQRSYLEKEDCLHLLPSLLDFFREVTSESDFFCYSIISHAAPLSLPPSLPVSLLLLVVRSPPTSVFRAIETFI